MALRNVNWISGKKESEIAGRVGKDDTQADLPADSQKGSGIEGIRGPGRWEWSIGLKIQELVDKPV